ncbi:hypothetical protein CAEBREN_10028 [Caenorhabditis brenneri]|uniref:Sdz-33 F-box domain-containing protein n=1 Tax=Caenorhabditis brenneri TaxID=135651 RepID=G0P189_CAEBE|nr:hypothetical protein CAEBREN_10028 [Caenorhabditis brenneri]
MGFPLLRLPQLALIVVLKQMNTIGLIDLSLCSKYLSFFAKKYIKKPKSLVFFADGEFQIRIKFQKSQFIFTFYSEESIQNGSEIPSSGLVEMRKYSGWGCKIMQRSFEKRNFGIRKWLDFFMALFNMDLKDLTIRDSVSRFDILSVKNLLNGLKIENLRIGFFIDDSFVKMILESVKVTRLLYLQSTSSFIENQKFEMDELRTNSIDWISMDQILTIDCRIIDIGYSKLTNEDFNLFLKNWRNGSNSKLEMFQARNENKDFWNKESILDGQEYRLYMEHRIFCLKPYNNTGDPREIPLHDSFEITRNDGVKGSVIVRNNTLQSSFMFLVSK